MKTPPELLAGSHSIARRIFKNAAHGREFLHSEFIAAERNVACHRHWRHGADQLQESLQRSRSPSQKASGQAAQRLRVEAQTPSSKRRSPLLNSRPRRAAQAVAGCGLRSVARCVSPTESFSSCGPWAVALAEGFSDAQFRNSSRSPSAPANASFSACSTVGVSSPADVRR